MGSWQVSGYTEQKRLGAGATGRVVLATDNETGVPVAIKYLTADPRFDPEFFATFRDEAQTLLAVDDPNVVRLYEYVETEHGAAIVMELVNGVTLRTLLAEAGPTTPEAALHVLKGSLLGLVAAHRRGMVHRDYKPANVLVDEDGTTKLADFGTATRVGGTEQVGTPAYMAPEQWTGSPASTATDIYAATATWFECLTGKIPFEAPSLITMREAHLYHPVPTGEVPNDLQGLAARGMAKDPGERPPDAAAFIEELEATARQGYGVAWEERGRGELARRVALLALLLPLGAGATTAGGAAAIQITRRAARGSRQLWTGAVAAAAVVLAIVAGIVAGKVQPPPTPTANVAAEPTLTIDATLPPTTPPPAPPTSASPSPSPSPSPSAAHTTHTAAPPPPPPPTTSSSSHSLPPPPPPPPKINKLTVIADVVNCGPPTVVVLCGVAHIHVETSNTLTFHVTAVFSSTNGSATFSIDRSGNTIYDFDLPVKLTNNPTSKICMSPRDPMNVEVTIADPSPAKAAGSHRCEPDVVG